MEFEFTDTIDILEDDLNEMVRRVEQGEEFCHAYYDIMAGYEDYDYCAAPLIKNQVEKEINQRIKKRDIPFKELENKILKALTNQPITSKKMAKKVDISPQKCSAVLFRLADKGIIKRCGEKPVFYFKEKER